MFVLFRDLMTSQWQDFIVSFLGLQVEQNAENANFDPLCPCCFVLCVQRTKGDKGQLHFKCFCVWLHLPEWLSSPSCVFLQLDSVTSLIQAAKNLMNAVVQTVKMSYIASTKIIRIHSPAGPRHPVVMWRMKAPEKKPLIKREKPEEIYAAVRKGSAKKKIHPVQIMSEFRGREINWSYDSVHCRSFTFRGSGHPVSSVFHVLILQAQTKLTTPFTYETLAIHYFGPRPSPLSMVDAATVQPRGKGTNIL